VEEVSFNDFKKLDIKIGKVLSVEKVEGTDKLLKFVFDFGDEQRQIIAGMREFFEDINSLIGLQMPVLLNIEPAVFCGNKSEGMILAADTGGKPVLLIPQNKVPNGSIIR
jgi:methionine--tRNA ligase beta chain